MDFLLNDLSLAGQFHDVNSFQVAVEQLMAMRQEILRLGSSLFCHRNLVNAKVTADLVMQQAIQFMPMEKRQAWVRWLATVGPFWEDDRLHGGNDWIEVNGEPVTDSAVGEAAICCLRGLARELVSFTPSDWNATPVKATWVKDDSDREMIDVSNHWHLASVQACLLANPPSIDSWAALNALAVRTYTRLTFADDAFEPLRGFPFAPAAAERIRVLLHILNEFKDCFDKDGKRSSHGHYLYEVYFKGDNSLFSDSSDSEKVEFRKELTFPHPEKPNQYLFCTWHGKVRHRPPIRIHFSWPVTADTPLYVVYVGKKRTMR